MATYYPKLAARVLRQADDLPEMYGNLDFTATPERFTTDPAAKSALPPRRGNRAAYLDDARLVELMRTALYLGDVPADRVAALSRDLSVTELIGLIRRACREGIENVPEAPPELAHDLIVRGMHLVGGGGMLKGLAHRLAEETEIPVTLVDQPLEAVVLGAGRCIEAYDQLRVMFMGAR